MLTSYRLRLCHWSIDDNDFQHLNFMGLKNKVKTIFVVFAIRKIKWIERTCSKDLEVILELNEREIF